MIEFFIIYVLGLCAVFGFLTIIADMNDLEDEKYDQMLEEQEKQHWWASQDQDDEFIEEQNNATER
jgi:hypothetical protein